MNQPNMKKLIPLAVLVLTFLASLTGEAPAADAAPLPPSSWKIGTPIVTYYAGPAMNEAVAKQMSEGGFNVVWCGEKDLDTRADIYSLGAILFHMVTGDVPYPGTSPTLVAKGHLEDPVPNPREKNPKLSAKTDWVIRKMLFKTRERRHPTPAELQKDLEELATGGTPAGFGSDARAASASPGPQTKLRRLTRGRYRR
jgi:serine/threonine protein kinase